MLLYDRASLGHDLIMRDAGAFRRQPRLNLREEPSVIGLGLLRRRELGLDGGEFGHGVEDISDGGWCQSAKDGIGPIWMSWN